MRAITATELRARMGELLDRASAGERILVERDHRPLAVLVSPEDAARLDGSAEERAERALGVLDRLAAFRARSHGRERQPDAAVVIRRERDAGHGEHG